MHPVCKKRKIEDCWNDLDEDSYHMDGFVVFDDEVNETHNRKRRRIYKNRKHAHTLAPMTEDTKRMIADFNGRKYKRDINIDEGLMSFDSDSSQSSDSHQKTTRLKRRILDIDHESDELDDVDNNNSNTLDDFVVDDTPYMKHQINDISNDRLYALFGTKVYTFLNILPLDVFESENTDSDVSNTIAAPVQCQTSYTKKTKFSVKLIHRISSVNVLGTRPSFSDASEGVIAVVKQKNCNPSPKRVTHRNIQYPWFYNISRREAHKRLYIERGYGHILFRPSSRGLNYLSMTWKMFDNILVDFCIKEVDKPYTNAVGKRLIVEQEEYTELDEIVHRLQPVLNEYVDDMINHKHFKYGDRNDIKQMLKEEMESNNKGYYSISFDHQKPGYFVLSYVANKKGQIKMEYIAVKPRGYKFRSQIFESPSELINFWKREMYANYLIKKSSK